MNETSRNIALVFEINTAIKYLRSGLTEIQKNHVGNDFYDPVLMYLSGGLERLFKSMVCLHYKEKHGRFPDTKELKNGKNGHDIESFKKEVEGMCIPIPREFASTDYDIITQDNFIDSVCKILSEYGIQSRYFNLDIILGREQKFDAKSEWEGLEEEVLTEFYGEEEYSKKLFQVGALEELREKSIEIIVTRLERFFRAIARQFVFGDFSSDAYIFVGEVGVFSDIKDENLGKTDYRKYRNGENIKR